MHTAGVAGESCRADSNGVAWRYSDDPCARITSAGLCRDDYLTTPTTRPVRTAGPACNATVMPVGIPKPAAATIEGGTQQPGAFSYNRSYVITYCRDCEEGPPSLPSNAVCADKDDPVQVSFPLPPMDWCITHINVYRLMPIQELTAAQVQHPELGTNNIQSLLNQEIDADFFLVATLPIDTMRFVDVGSFQTQARQLMVSEYNDPPPTGMIISGETPAGSLVGFQGPYVYFSERNIYHAWPVKNRVRLDYDVTDIAVCDNTVYAFTAQGVFIIEDDADCKDASCRRPRRAPCPFPLCAVHGFTCVPDGVIFASRNGLIRMLRDGNFETISGAFFTPEDWRDIDPCSIRMAKYEGMLFFTTKFTAM